MNQNQQNQNQQNQNQQNQNQQEDDLPVWFNRRLNNNYDYFISLLERKIFVYNRTGNYYGRMNMYLVVPSILITSCSSIFSFLSTSDMFSENSKNILLTIVGITTIFSTMTQSLSNAFGYGTKKEMFLHAADEYDKVLMKIRFEKNNPNQEDFLNIIEKEISKIEEMCKYLPPNWIVLEWENRQNKLNLNNTYNTHNNHNNFNNLNNLNNLNNQNLLINE